MDKEQGRKDYEAYMEATERHSDDPYALSLLAREYDLRSQLVSTLHRLKDEATSVQERCRRLVEKIDAWDDGYISINGLGELQGNFVDVYAAQASLLREQLERAQKDLAKHLDGDVDPLDEEAEKEDLR